MARLTGCYSPRCTVVRDGTSRQAVVPENFVAIRYNVSLGGVGLQIGPRVLAQESIQALVSAIGAIDFVVLTKLFDGYEAVHSSRTLGVFRP